MLKQLCYAILFTGLMYSNSLAANVSVERRELDSTGDLAYAEVLMTGVIEKHDLQKLKIELEPLLKIAPPFGGFWDRLLLLLDSEGGDFEEALKISQYLRDQSIQTHVKSGDVCFSACAIIFMHGVIRTPDDVEFASRTLAIGAKLGFHAPYLVSKSEKTGLISRDKAIQFAEFSYSRALKQLATLLESGSKIFPQSLIADMLKKGPTELQMVDSIRDVIAWDIPIKNPPSITKLRKVDLAMTCENAWSKRVDAAPEITMAELEQSEFEQPVLEKEWDSGSQLYSYGVRSHNGGYLSAKCRLVVSKAKSGLQVGLVGFEYLVDVKSISESDIPALPFRYMHDPAKKLADF